MARTRGPRLPARSVLARPYTAIDQGNVGWTTLPVPPRDDSPSGDAADFLRRKGWIVCRAKTLNVWDSKSAWIVGTVRMTSEAMQKMASDKGWQYRGKETAR